MRDHLRRNDPMEAILLGARPWRRAAPAALVIQSSLPDELVLTGTALRSRDARIRRVAISGLRSTHPALLFVVARGLTDPDRLVREAAEGLLDKLPTKKLLKSVEKSGLDLGPLVCVITYPIGRGRDAIRSAIAGFGHQALEPLLWLQDQGNAAERAESLTILGLIAEPSTRASIATALVDKDPAVRAAAVKAMACLPHDEATFEIVERAFADPDPSVRSEAVWALSATHGEPSRPLFDYNRQTAASLARAALGDTNTDVRKEAVRALGRRYSLARLIGNRSASRRLDAFRPLFSDEDRVFASLLSSERDDSVASTLLYALEDLTSVGLISDDGAVHVTQSLVERLGADTCPSGAIGHHAAQALARLAERGIPALVAAARAPEPRRRADAFYGIGQLPHLDASCISVMIDGLSDPDRSARNYCSDAWHPNLYLRHATMELRQQLALLGHENPEVRLHAIPDDSYHLNAEFVEPLTAIAENDPELRVRLQAVRSLSRHPSPRTDSVLCALMMHSDPDTRKLAIRAARFHRRPAPTEALRSALHDTDVSVREEAEAVLAEQDKYREEEPAA